MVNFMKKNHLWHSLIALSLIGVFNIAETAYAQIFSQDFAAGGVTSDYVSATPNTSQWNAISTADPSNKLWTIASNALQLSTTGNGGSGAYASRSTDFSPVPSAIQFSFTFDLLSSNANFTSAIDFAVGSGFGTTNNSESNANTYAKFAINTTNTSGYQVRDNTGGQLLNGSSTFTGANTFTWVANNSGASTTYLAPDGSTESLANDTWDLWVGTSKELNDRSATTATQTITDFKFGSQSGTGINLFTAQFDNFTIAILPEPSSLLLVGLGIFGVGLGSRRRLAGR
jgi:hypothetical protein